MSLQVWLPLNGNTNNYGISSVTASSASDITYVDGKIGKCASASSSVSITVTVPDLANMLTNGRCYSLACWVKITDVASTSNSWVIKLGGTNSCGLWWEYNSPRWVWNENDNGKRCANVTMSADTNWHHLVTTIDKTVTNQITAKHYIDGLPATDYETQTWDCSSHVQPTGNTITITPYVAMLNDLRFYDHVLSVKEIKEISKALVCHYPLDNNGCGQPNLFDFESIASKWVNDGETTMVNYTDENYGNVLKITSVADKRIYKYFSTAVWTKKQTYTVSFYAKASSNTASMKMSRSNTDFTTETFTLTTEWKRYVGHITTTGTAANGTLSINTYTTGDDIYITKIKMEEGSIDTPYCPGSDDSHYSIFSSTNNIEVDTSGYKNDGTKNNVGVSTDTERYSVSSVFNGTNSFIACGRGGMVRDQITVSLWAYANDWSSYSTYPTMISCTQTGGWSINMSTSGNLQVTVGYGESSNAYLYTNIQLSTLTAGWHMTVLIYDGFTLKLYVDGEYKAATTPLSTKMPIYYNSTNGIFIGCEAGTNQTTPPSTDARYFDGKISDVRIYAIALSDNDILELYNVGASIADNGTVLCGDFVEE